MVNVRGSCLVVLAGAVVAHAASITVVPTNQSVNVSQQFLVDLQISELGAGAAPSLGTFDIDFSFDPGILSFVSATYGKGLDVGGLGSLQVTTPGVGMVNLFQLSLDSAADLDALQPASFVLATLRFNGLSSGTSVLALSPNAIGDANGAALAAIITNGSVAVGNIPEPSGFVFLISGLSSLVILLRWRLPQPRKFAPRSALRTSRSFRPVTHVYR